MKRRAKNVFNNAEIISNSYKFFHVHVHVYMHTDSNGNSNRDKHIGPMDPNASKLTRNVPKKYAKW